MPDTVPQHQAAASVTTFGPRARPETPALEPLAVGREQLAALLSIGVATLDRWDAAGLLGPVGVRKAGRKLWSLSELRQWVDAGMPGRKEWLARRTAGKAGR
jgi:hypothetical protein